MRNVDFTAHSCAIATVTTTTPATTTTVAVLRASVRPCAIANLNTDAYDGRNIHYPRLWQERTRHDVLPEQQQQAQRTEETSALDKHQPAAERPHREQRQLLYAKGGTAHSGRSRWTFLDPFEPLWATLNRFGHNAKIICRKFAVEIGNPTEILDTPKEITITPRVFSDTPKVTLVLTF